MRIALTGGIAEGKTTVLEAIGQMGIPTESADRVAARVLQQPEVRSAVASGLGLDGSFTREELRARITSDPTARRFLNRLMHRAVVEEMWRSPAVVFEVPLLVEACLFGRFDRVWVTCCGHEEQIRRLTERLGDRKEAQKMAALHLPTCVKAVFADRILRTDQPLGLVLEDVRSLLGEYGLIRLRR